MIRQICFFIFIVLFSNSVKHSFKVETVPVPAHINKLDIYLTGSIARIKLDIHLTGSITRIKLDIYYTGSMDRIKLDIHSTGSIARIKLDIHLTGSIARIKENSVNRTCLLVLGDQKFDCFVIFIKSFVSKPLSVFYNADNFIWSYTDCCDFIISMCS